MKPRLSRELMALRVVRELPPGSYVNLGIGLPLLVADLLRPEQHITLQAEVGILGYGPYLQEEGHPDYVDAGSRYVTVLPGASFFSSAEAFGMIRSGRLDVGVLGAYQVSEKGDLANWMVPARGVGSVGGAMDIIAGAKQIIALMEHTTKTGEPKILRECTYPLTATACVDLIVTDLAVIQVTEGGLLLTEVAPGFTPQEVQALTEPQLRVAPDLKEMEF